MTLPRLYSLNLYWEDHPPMHFLMATWVGYKGRTKKQVSKDDDMAAMLGELAAAGFHIKT